MRLGAAEGEEGEALSIETILRLRTINQYCPSKIATEVDRRAAFIIDEEHLSLPGVKVDVERPQYTYGDLLGHPRLCAPSSTSSTCTSRTSHFGYSMDDQVGLAGIEQSMEDRLRGTKGQKHYPGGRAGARGAVVAEKPPVEGHSLMLTRRGTAAKGDRGPAQGDGGAKSEVGVVIAMRCARRRGAVHSLASRL